MLLVQPTKHRFFEPDKWNSLDVTGAYDCFAYALNDTRIKLVKQKDFMPLYLRHIIKSEADYQQLQKSFNVHSLCMHQGDLQREYSKRKNFREDFKLITKAFQFSLRAHFAGLKRIYPEKDGLDPSQHILAFNHVIGHVYRLDSDGTWSSFWGGASQMDGQKNLITNLEKAVEFCDGEYMALEDIPKHFTSGQTQYYIVPEGGVLVDNGCYDMARCEGMSFPIPQPRAA